MLPLSLSVFLFLYFTCLGRAAMEVAGLQRQMLRGWLVAPTVGMSLVLLATTVLSQAGLPVRSFALELLVTGAVLAALVFWWRRPILPLRALGLFGAVLGFSLLYTGWPALRTGFDWVSYASDDMANYCLGAQRFLNNGFFRVPTGAELSGLDYSQYYWFMHVAGLMRFGSEILLAWVAGWTGLGTLPAFMPLIIALSLVQVSAAGALVLATCRHRRVALLATALLALSPTFLIGTYYQLIAQVGGLALMLGLAALLFARHLPTRRIGLGRLALIVGIQSAALAIYYPEITPFAGLGYAFFVFFETVRTRRPPFLRLILPVLALLVAVIILRHNVFSYLVTLGNQAASGAAVATGAFLRFPFYLVPSGLADAFGFLPLAQFKGEPWDSLLIFAGGLMLGVVAIRAVRDSWRGLAHGGILLGMLLLGVVLFRNRSDFGLFKLVMFAQPLIACVLAGLFAGARARWILWPGAVVFCLLQLPAARYYGVTSLGERKGNLIELPEVSFRRVVPPIAPPGATLVTGLHNPIAAKFAALESGGRPLYFLSYDYFNQLMGNFRSRVDVFGAWVARWHPEAESILHGAALQAWQQRQIRQTGELFKTKFKYSVLADQLRPDDRLLGITVMLDILNRSTTPGDQTKTGRDFFSTGLRAEQANRLIFVPSSRGEHYYTMDNPLHTSFYQVERDFFNPGQVFSALGRFLLLRIENPAREVYLRLSLTKSVMGQGLTVLDMPLQVLGRAPREAQLTGAGAANIFIGPIQPVEYVGAHYVAIDFGTLGNRIESPRQGLMKMFNRDVPMDWRYVVAFGRDISCYDAAGYAALPRPRALGLFPADLLQAGLEFSGWFEDGWISARSFVVLGPAQAGEKLIVRGVVPGLAGLVEGQSLTVRINGEASPPFSLPPGDFALEVPVPASAATTRVELEFARSIALPSPDDRPIAAKIAFVGLTAK